MEGPSIHLAAEQLRPFIGKQIASVSGNSRIGIDRLHGQQVKDIFAWGKHLVFQFDTLALRVHFMLWGTFASTVNGNSVTGDYRRTGPPRLVMNFPNGEVTIWAASVKWVEVADPKAAYDFTADIMSDRWNPRAALKKVRRQHYQERGAVPHANQPVPKDWQHSTEDAQGDRRRCAGVLPSLPRAAPCVRAQKKSRGVPQEPLSCLRWENRPNESWPARASQLLLR